mmetsp:Transcript_10331/g.25642  ORF Transcript_10331/g.25642 Transcript_10331/m.25642 type:complete len:548 (-) Transcript_10331:198-1841(-)
MDRSFDDEKSIRYKGEGSDSAYSLRRKGGGDSADAHSLRRKGEVAETLGLRVSPVDFESSADLNGQKGVSKSWVSDSMLPALMQKIDPSEKRALMRKGEGFCYRGHIAKYIADHTPPPLDDPELLARHDRCMEVEKMAVRNMTAQGKNIEAWMQSAILPDEETILAMECSTFRNVISCPDKVGDGMVCVTQHKTTQKHRLHFFMMEEKASFHASETDSELGCLFRILGVNGESSYTSTRSRTSFCSVISVEECVLHASLYHEETSTAKRRIIFNTAPLCCVSEKITEEDVRKAMHRKRTTCLQRLLGFFMVEKWSASAKRSLSQRFQDESLARLVEEEGLHESAVGVRNVERELMDAVVVNSVCGMHLVHRSTADNRIVSAWIGFKRNVPECQVGQLVSILQAHKSPRPPALHWQTTEAVWRLGSPMLQSEWGEWRGIVGGLARITTCGSHRPSKRGLMRIVKVIFWLACLAGIATLVIWIIHKSAQRSSSPSYTPTSVSPPPPSPSPPPSPPSPSPPPYWTMSPPYWTISPPPPPPSPSPPPFWGR